MQTSRGRINNKEKQYVAGNWGHPRKFLKKHTKIDDPMIQENSRHAKAKRKRKERKEYKLRYKHCPFCESELPLDVERISIEKLRHPIGLSIFEEMYRVKNCAVCKSREVAECPACKKRTWFNGASYKHQDLGCGFIGSQIKKGDIGNGK